ncbi:quercetin dioxygenase-like cupin family protein/DNA-binding XRE family transcriptional regulator [Desulfobaculum xiamenense]|uniref:Quercetin dioxygenase-like cupin family protein/DNA-binding XRE family transcriptional regulator n=1 Tax=Desulfobaculum xiamenense TaxID=995050 RepID=A0A846QPD0_9BACT|nr:XRE family transcriptional regulator [Desulfobaculum xiamenense]NJB69027.1 quercetin dioxygenase-like cupin family protein/DNA-binding XRE family transcriptional regulator [Desulfobaculum xiamenense]
MQKMEKAYKEIAPRLRGLRDALDMSVADLAAKVGVDEATVAGYESGTIEIPVSFLFNVAQACGVDLTVLLSGGDAHLTSYSLVKAGEGLAVERRKDYDYKSLAYRFTGRKMEPFRVRVPAKEAGETHFATHPGQEFIYMLSGRLEINLDGNTVVLEPGDSLYFGSQTPHSLRGLDGNEAEFLDVII